MRHDRPTDLGRLVDRADDRELGVARGCLDGGDHSAGGLRVEAGGRLVARVGGRHCVCDTGPSSLSRDEGGILGRATRQRAKNQPRRGRARAAGRRGAEGGILMCATSVICPWVPHTLAREEPTSSRKSADGWFTSSIAIESRLRWPPLSPFSVPPPTTTSAQRSSPSV